MLSSANRALPWFARGALPIALLTLAHTAVAAEPRPENVAAARALALEGIKLADAGHCDAAIERLERAEELYHAPSIQGRLGECQVSVGKLVLGTETLNRVIREPLPSGAPRAFRAAQQRARRVLAEAQPRIAKLTVNVDEVPPGVTFRIDGVEMAQALLGIPIPVDPGERSVTLNAPGYLESQQRVQLGDGAAEVISIRLERAPEPKRDPAPPPVIRKQPSRATLNAEDAASNRTSPVLAYTLLGVGAAGIATGAVFGVLALDAKGELDDKCPGKVCSDGKLKEKADQHALIATLGIGVGAACAVSGVVLLLTGNSGATAPDARATLPSVKPWLGFASAGIHGSF